MRNSWNNSSIKYFTINPATLPYFYSKGTHASKGFKYFRYQMHSDVNKVENGG